MGTAIEAQIKNRLTEQELELSERLGQHFLIDGRIVESLVNLTSPGAKVIEVGSGIGHVTEQIARRAGSVVGIEIDRRFKPELEEVQTRNPNINFVISDALNVSLKSLIDKDGETQVIANIPFHITEPFLRKLIDLPITNAVLIVGDNIAKVLQESEDSLAFGKMSLLGQTFFDIREEARIPKDSFYPPPRTESSVLVLDPRERDEISRNPALHIFASLFRKEGKFDLVKNDIKQAIVEASENAGRTLSKKEKNKRARSNARQELRRLQTDFNSIDNVVLTGDKEDTQSRRHIVLSQAQANQVIEKMGIPESVLNKPFFRLDNHDIRELTAAVRGYYK